MTSKKQRSRFLHVKCNGCGTRTHIFSKASSEVNCSVCHGLLATPTGGKAIIKGEIKILDED